MVIGGLALPSCRAFRTTVDLDIAVRLVGKKDFDSSVAAAKRAGFMTGLAALLHAIDETS